MRRSRLRDRCGADVGFEDIDVGRLFRKEGANGFKTHGMSASTEMQLLIACA
jgi:hypothetical protein